MTAIDTSAASVTVSVLDSAESLLLIPLRLAEITVVPMVTGEASPSLPPALLMVAIPYREPGYLRGNVLCRRIGIGAGSGEVNTHS